MLTGRTIVHAIVGAVVGVVLSFIPFSTVIGGAVAGFLEGPNGREGAIVGALAGTITFLPFVGIGILLVAFMGVGIGTGGLPLGGAMIALVFFAVALATVLLYTVGLAVLGGYLGAYLAREYPDRRASTRRSIGMADRRDEDRYPREPDRPATSRGHTRSREVTSTERLEDETESDRGTEGTGERGNDTQRDRDAEDRTAPTRWHEDRESDREP